jgi:hypothetical protein
VNSYKWTCLACKTPNIFVHDDSKEGQVYLSCVQCGEPGVFQPEDPTRIVMQPAYPSISTDAHLMDSSMSSTYLVPPQYLEIK